MESGDVHANAFQGIWTITPDDRGIAQALQEALLSLGCDAHISNSPDQNSRGLILLDALNFSSASKTPAEITEFYLSAFEKIKAVSKSFSQTGGVLLTVQDTGGQFGLESTLEGTGEENEHKSWRAGLTGVIKTASLEWPHARCRALDIAVKKATPDKISAVILQEIQDLVLNQQKNTKFDEREIGIPDIQNKKRIKLKVALEKISPEFQKPLTKNTVLVVTGGARGITAACLIALSKKQPLKLALLGRSELVPEPLYCHGVQEKETLKKLILQEAKHLKTPRQVDQYLNQIIAHREILQTISMLEKSGSEVMYFSVDVSDNHALNIALDKVRKQFGKIDGIVHGAGVLADKFITDKSIDQFKRVFETKVTGLINLLKDTRKEPLKYLILFSSVAGRYGNIGQVDYACANEVLNKIAQVEQHRRKTCIVKSINWAPWDSGMVDAQLKKMFEDRNIPILSLEAGVNIFVDELTHVDPVNAEVIYGSLFNEMKSDFDDDEIPQKKFSIHFQTDEYILSHQIKNMPVLPACIVLDWFLRSVSETFEPNQQFECHHFKVLKGIPLENFSKGSTFVFEVQQKDHLRLKLLDSQKMARYSADFEFKQIDIPGSKKYPLRAQKNCWPFEVPTLYQSAVKDAPLFHGKYFQGIKALLDYSAEGGSALLYTLHSNPRAHWPNQPWQLDVLAFDSALQLLLLWTHAKLGKGSLPTGIEKIIFYQRILPGEPVYCEFKTQVIDNLRTRSHVELWDKQGKLIAELINVEMCVVI